LRREVSGLRVQLNLGGGSFKAQFRRADRSGAQVAVVLGEDELKQGRATVKPLRGEGTQQQVQLSDIEDWFRSWLDS